jgi:excisionase family DNA binding protein
MEVLASTERLLTVEDVAARLAISRRAVYVLVESGRIDYLRIGDRRIRFMPKQVERFIEGSRQVGEAVDAP